MQLFCKENLKQYKRCSWKTGGETHVNNLNQNFIKIKSQPADFQSVLSNTLRFCKIFKLHIWNFEKLKYSFTVIKIAFPDGVMSRLELVALPDL